MNPLVRIFFLITLSLIVGCSEKSDSPKTTDNPSSSKTERMSVDARVTTSVTLRMGPSVNSAKATCIETVTEWPKDQTGWNCFSGACDRQVTALPPDVNVFVVEKTDTMEKVDKWNNYWYRIGSTITLSETSTIHCDVEPWIYGEFIIFP